MRLPCLHNGYHQLGECPEANEQKRERLAGHAVGAAAQEVREVYSTEDDWAVVDDRGPLIRPGKGSWVCGECPYFASTFEALERHVYETHLGAEAAAVARPKQEQRKGGEAGG